MSGKLVSLEQCLFDAFMYPEEYNPQEMRQMWAIVEGYRRNMKDLQGFEFTVAKKEHKCVRGCEIKPRDTYITYPYSYSWDTVIKLCAGCTAMVFYFLQVFNTLPYLYSHWDTELNEPVLIGKKQGPDPNYISPGDGLKFD